jgi:SAM-dependent methyltransferase
MYASKIGIYQGDCDVLLGKFSRFSDYVKDFSLSLEEKEIGLDLGTGPSGCNGVFFTHCILDGCDIEEEVVLSLPVNLYRKSFRYILGSEDKLPYEDKSLDFVICSCVIQHLNNIEELEFSLKEISRVLKNKGKLYLMFKAGTNNTLFTHFNNYYSEERTFRVFHPDDIISLGVKNHLTNISKNLLLDDNWIPYSCLIFLKY